MLAKSRSRKPIWIKRMVRRGKECSLEVNGQAAVQLPQLKHASGLMAP
jgi:hypothetical protein